MTPDFSILSLQTASYCILSTPISPNFSEGRPPNVFFIEDVFHTPQIPRLVVQTIMLPCT